MERLAANGFVNLHHFVIACWILIGEENDSSGLTMQSPIEISPLQVKTASASILDVPGKKKNVDLFFMKGLATDSTLEYSNKSSFVKTENPSLVGMGAAASPFLTDIGIQL